MYYSSDNKLQKLIFKIPNNILKSDYNFMKNPGDYSKKSKF